MATHYKDPVLAAMLLLLTASLATGTAAAAPLEVYGRLPSLEEVALSPDGARLAFVRTSGNDRLLARDKPEKKLPLARWPCRAGPADTVVPFDQSRDMYDALKHAKKDVEMVTLKKEDHWLSRSETRLQMLQSSVAFLRGHNPPD